MLKRKSLADFEELLQNFPAVAIIGPRQVGKTTLARSLASGRDSMYLDLESVADRNKLADPQYYFQQYSDKLIVLDEIHKLPEVFQVMRGAIDENRRQGREAGQFLILGSASIDLLKQSGESLAGRIAYGELFPFNLEEIKGAHVSTLWNRGGFPNSYLAKNDRMSMIWRQSFIQTYLERDIPELGPRIPAERLRRFWIMLAHCHGSLLNAANLAKSLEVDNKTISSYLDLLVDLLLVRRLRPWHANVKKRLVKSPKTWIRDSGLLHALLSIPSMDDLLGNPVSGNSWEGFVIENILSCVPRSVDAYFYRTATGNEIDLLLNQGDKLWAIEIKRSMAPKLSKGFHIACDDIQPTAKWVVYTGEEPYMLPDGIKVVPLNSIMEAVQAEFCY